MKKIFNSRLFLVIICGIIFTSIGIYASELYKAKDVQYELTDASWEVTNVSKALNDLYEDSKSNDSSEIIVGMSMTQSITDTSSWNHTGVCSLIYNNETLDTFQLPTFNYNTSSKTTMGTTKIIEGKKVRLDCNTAGSLNSDNAIMTIKLNLYVEEELVRTISIQNVYTSAPSLSYTWNIAGY